MSLRIYLDEDVETDFAKILTAEGLDTITALDEGKAHLRIPDREQLIYATSLGRAICTYNVKDYSPLAIEWAATGRDHAGIILGHRRPIAEQLSRFHALAARYPDGMANLTDYL